MILGIGNDIIEVERVEKACRNSHFMQRCFSETEISLFQGKPQSLAGNFAAKEAVVKAFGTGCVQIAPCEVEILREESGKPYVRLQGKAGKYLKDNMKIHVSISNLKTLASAVAVIEMV